MPVISDDQLHINFDEYLNAEGEILQLKDEVIRPAEAFKVLRPKAYRQVFENWLSLQRALGNIAYDGFYDRYYTDDQREEKKYG